MTDKEAINKIRQIRQEFPFPWHEQVFADGEIKLIDATGAEVALFSIVALVTALTKRMTGK